MKVWFYPVCIRVRDRNLTCVKSAVTVKYILSACHRKDPNHNELALKVAIFEITNLFATFSSHRAGSDSPSGNRFCGSELLTIVTV